MRKEKPINQRQAPRKPLLIEPVHGLNVPICTGRLPKEPFEDYQARRKAYNETINGFKISIPISDGMETVTRHVPGYKHGRVFFDNGAGLNRRERRAKTKSKRRVSVGTPIDGNTSYAFVDCYVQRNRFAPAKMQFRYADFEVSI